MALTAPLGEVTFDINESVVIKEDNLFLVCGNDGVIPLQGPHPLGLYYNDCRFLSGREMTVFGHTPRLLVCTASSGRGAVHEMTNAELEVGHGRVVPPQSIQVRVERELRAGGLDERITLISYEPELLEGDVVLRVAAGFEPMMWLRGAAPGFRPKRSAARATRDGLAIEVTGRDGVERRLQIAARPRAEVKGRELRWAVRLRRGKPQTLAVRYVPAEGDARPRVSPPPAARRRPGPADGLPAGHVRVATDDQLFDRVLRRSLADLTILRSRLGRQSYYAAGIPWFATLFGRDSLITAIEMLAYDPGIAEQTLRVLGRRLGREVNDERDEEPGKVLHELRVGELANLGAMPFARYYGSADSTPLFLCLLAEHADWSGDLRLFRAMRAEVDAALEWIDRYGDADGDRLVEYARRSPEGLENQGWKDSVDGVVDARGRPLEPPIALAEVQGYVFRAKRRIARLFELDGDHERAARLRAEARDLHDRIERLWLDDLGFYSMGMDGRKRPSRALASNQGHLLWSLAVPKARARAARDALMSEPMFSGWGIRTLARTEPGYNPVGYHTGSVWPHDTALIAYGLRKYGFDEDFAALFEGLLDAASHFSDYRLPELFAGFSRAEYGTPVPYPVACHPQAWAAGSIPYLLRAGLGIIADGLAGRVRIVRPSLPAWLNHVEVEGLRVGGASIDLRFERAAGQVTIADVKIDGEVEVVLEISSSRDPDEIGI